jgi:four helix bundle protein
MTKLQVKRAEYSSPGEPGKRGFEDLECYKLALDLVVNAHELVKILPGEEKFDLAMQLRRSSKSIVANIAEGYGRYHYLDSLRCFSIARGELNETIAHFINARTLGYINQEYFETVYQIARKAEATLNGYMKFVRKQKADHSEFDKRQLREENLNYGLDTPFKDK